MADLKWILGLGLGRGLDATDVEPWQHISSFQVREVTTDNVVETNGTAEMNVYEEDIKSVVDQHAEIAASANKSGIAKIGIFAEKSRSLKQTKKMVGSRVLTRTITFRSDFANLPVNSLQNIEAAYLGNLETKADHVQIPDFEEKLCAWILQRIKARQFQATERAKFTGEEASLNGKPVHTLSGNNAISKLSDYINSLEKNCTDFERLSKDCDLFVRKGAGGTRAITHYVYQLELGAFEYNILTQEEYNSKLHLGANVGGEHPIAGGGEVSSAYTHTHNHEQKSLGGKSVGKINDGTVNKGTDDEKVISVEIKPVHTLVNHLLYLQEALKEAESRYIVEKQDLTEGPFLISCSDESKRIYWSVHDTGSVVGTQLRQEASAFYLKPSTNEQHPYEFSIAHFNTQKGSQNDRFQQTRYLKAHVNLFGSNSGPLKVKDYVKPCDRLLTLHSGNPDETDDYPLDIRSLGKEPVFFKCTRRKRRFSGYITMTKQSQSGKCHGTSSSPEFQYITTCVRSRNSQNNPHTSLLFNVERLEDGEMGEDDEQSKPSLVHDLQIHRERNGIRSINISTHKASRYPVKYTRRKFHCHFNYKKASVKAVSLHDRPRVEPHALHREEFVRINSGHTQKFPGQRYQHQMALTSVDQLQSHTMSLDDSHLLTQWDEDEYMYMQSDLAPNFLRNVASESDHYEDSHTTPQIHIDSLAVPQHNVQPNATSEALKDEVIVNVEVYPQDENKEHNA